MFSDIVIAHAKKYPLLQPTDVVKLCYQSEFGVSHFVNGGCLEYIEKEYASALKGTGAEMIEKIGGGYVRVNLASLAEDDLPLLAEAFEKTSRSSEGTLLHFEKLLDEALNAVKANGELFSFTADEFGAFLGKYESLGFPPVRHSGVYRDAYAPSYRVIKENYVNFITRTEE